MGTGTTCVRLQTTFVRLFSLELQHPISRGSELHGCWYVLVIRPAELGMQQGQNRASGDSPHIMLAQVLLVLSHFGCCPQAYSALFSCSSLLQMLTSLLKASPFPYYLLGMFIFSLYVSPS